MSYLLALLLIAGSPGPERPLPHRRTVPIGAAADTAGLSPLIGSWVGTGRGLAGPIRDSLAFAPVLGGRFLRFTMKALSGDRFEAEGYLWIEGTPPRLRLSEFTSFGLVRDLAGTPDRLRWTVEEHLPGRDVRVALALIGPDSLWLQEIDLNQPTPSAFVDERFVRQHP